MGLMLSPSERVELAEAASKEKRVRNWRRMRAIELLAEGRKPEAVAEALGCARSSVYAWTKAWRETGLSGLPEGSRPGRKRSLEGRAELLLEELLEGGDRRPVAFVKAVVAANRVYDSVEELAERAVAYLDGLTEDDVLRLSGLLSSKFNWLPT
jgi:transposase